CQELYARYVEKFGDRCTDELKLESPTLHEDPLPLFRAIGHLAARLRPGASAPIDDDGQKQNKARHRAETHVREKLTWHPLRRAIFTWVLKNARDRVRDRENLRFERTRVFGCVRMIVSELGRRLYAADSLEDAADVFYLTIDEIFGFAEGAACCTDLKSMVRLRKEEFARFASIEPPSERFCTRGMVNCANSFRETSTAHFDLLEKRRIAGAVETQGPSTVSLRGSARHDRAFDLAARAASVTSPGEDSADTRRGTGCCPGTVRGRVRVVKNPKDIPSESGCVLVAERTDPSWILIFPSAAGVLVERGSLLSHSAIVARELGIPTVVSVSGLTAWLEDGDIVEFDGATGVIARLPDIDSLAAATSASTLEENVR
ncbi:MAG TPA: PEP-utilizing enzyme, partial [Terriglobales bacterium]|nr:PEP-utilizing enzyme [Terriglobales bacterium]